VAEVVSIVCGSVILKHTIVGWNCIKKIVVIPSKRRNPRRGCKSPHLHQKYSKLDAGSMKVENGLITISRLEIKNTFDGGAPVSIGLDIRDGNSVGDDCKSSKTRKCNRKYKR